MVHKLYHIIELVYNNKNTKNNKKHTEYKSQCKDKSNHNLR
jgi:hypothetical protein